MCILYKKAKGIIEFSGYKTVIKINEKYYSPATGIEYIPGPVPMSNPGNIPLLGNFKHVSNPDNINHIPSYNGYTSVFIDMSDAIEFTKVINDDITGLKREKAVTLIIKISEDLRFGEYHSLCFGNRTTMVGGKYIESLKEI